MKVKNKIYFIIAGFLLLLISGGSLHAEQMRVTENLRKETVLLPPSAPERSQLILVSFSTITAEGEIIAALAVYDDPRTRKPDDYLELYDEAGGLLSVSWVDSFRIRWTAMDRGLLQEEASRLEGILVLIPEGIPA
ncbi:MAG: hypothetical protein V3U06_03085 [Candidatus Binatia bacterium]